MYKYIESHICMMRQYTLYTHIKLNTNWLTDWQLKSENLEFCCAQYSMLLNNAMFCNPHSACSCAATKSVWHINMLKSERKKKSKKPTQRTANCSHTNGYVVCSEISIPIPMPIVNCKLLMQPSVKNMY